MKGNSTINYITLAMEIKDNKLNDIMKQKSNITVETTMG